MNFGFDNWQIYAFGSAIFAALTAIFGKIGVAETKVEVATFIRTVIILLFYFFIISFNNNWPSLKHVHGRSIIFLLLSGIATGASWLCYYKALQIGPASQVAPVDKMSIVITTILAVIFLGESLSWEKILGVSLITLGSLLMILR